MTPSADSVTPSADSDADRLAGLFVQHAPRVFAYVRRQVARADVDDIVSDTFMVAWRRRGEVPEDALPWLLVVARKTVANWRRTTARRPTTDFTETALDQLAGADPSVEELVVARTTMLKALGKLNADERECLLMIAWDGLSTKQAAAVADCSVGTFSVRLHRARQHLTATLALQSESAGRRLQRSTRERS